MNKRVDPKDFLIGFLTCGLAMLFINAVSAPSHYGYLDDPNSPYWKTFVRLDGRNINLASDWVHPSAITAENVIVNNVAQAKILDLTPAVTAGEVSDLISDRPSTPIFTISSILGHVEVPYFYNWVVLSATESLVDASAGLWIGLNGEQRRVVHVDG